MKHHLKKLNESLKDFIRNYGMIFGLVFSIAALGLGGYNTYLLKNGAEVKALPKTSKADKLTRVEVEKMIKNGAPFLGNTDASVTIVEYADFQCPYCGKYHAQIFPEIKQKYIDTGKVKFVYMNFAFLGEESLRAAEAAKCAGDQNKFWQYHDYLYEHQQGENRGAFAVEHLKSFAGKIGLNQKVFDSCLDSRTYKTKVEEETKVAARFGVGGTPATFVNDFLISGLQGLSYFTNKIDDVLQGK